MSDNKQDNSAIISAEENREMFDAISARYDLINRIISLGLDKSWRSKAIALLAPFKAGQYLDIGCGTCDTAIVMSRLSSKISIAGIDPSVQMLNVGNEKIVAAGLSDRVTVQVGDAGTLPYSDNIFNGAISAFVLRNVTDRQGSIQEAYRVLRAGGRYVILDLCNPESRWLYIPYVIFTSTIVPLIACLLSSYGAYKYLLKSIRCFPSSSVIVGMLEHAGFKDCTSVPLTFGAARVFVGTK